VSGGWGSLPVIGGLSSFFFTTNYETASCCTINVCIYLKKVIGIVSRGFLKSLSVKRHRISTTNFKIGEETHYHAKNPVSLDV
jgi:hypothetical protein